MEYIYTGEVVSLASADCLSLVETANRLCLPHLVSVAEMFIVSELQRMDKGNDSVEQAILLLEPAEVSGCVWFVCVCLCAYVCARVCVCACVCVCVAFHCYISSGMDVCEDICVICTSQDILCVCVFGGIL